MHDIKETMRCIEVRGLKKYYSFKGGRTLRAVDGVDLTIHTGEIFGVVGESGCGKSTLGKCMMRLTDLTDGQVLFNGKDISKQSRRTLRSDLQRMQMIFQNPYSSFNPKLKISYSLAEPCRLKGMSKSQIKAKMDQFLEYISLSENELNRFPHELSGGQLQRLAIARALLLDPDFIVADEPVSALDVSVQAQILNLIEDLKQNFRMTMMFISHDMTVVEHICDKVAVMYLGAVVEWGESDVVFRNIQHPYTQALISAIPVIDLDQHKRERIILQGDIPTALEEYKGCRFASRCSHCQEICKNQPPKLREIEPAHYVACHCC